MENFFESLELLQQEQKELEYIDLCLPSGNKWASENIDDKYHMLDEAMELGGEHLPTIEDFEELVSETTQEFVDNGLKFIASNGNSIVLPAIGIKNGNFASPITNFTSCYWVSQENNEETMERKAFFFNTLSKKVGGNPIIVKYDKMPIRTLKRPVPQQ